MRSVFRYLTVSVVALGVFSLAGCRDREQGMNQDRTATDPGTVNQDLPADQDRPATNQDRPASVQAANVKNSEAAAVLRTVHQGEMEEAEYVLERLRTEPAKKLARMMREDHGTASRELDRILKNSSIIEQENDKVRELKKDSQDNLRELRETDAKDLDMKYIELQIEEHEDVLELLDDKLIEDANDPALSKFLRDQRGKIASHLEHAKQAKEDVKALR